MRARARELRIVALVVVAQAVLVASYLVVEPQRGPNEHSGDPLVEAPTTMDAPLPPLEIRLRNGRAMTLQAPRRHTLLHFWGTWCPPCRAELPGLLALPTRHPVDVIAVALDASWAPVDGFLDGSIDERVVLGDSARVQGVLGVRTLPATFLVSPRGRLVARFDGARRWGDSPFCERWLRAERTRTPR